MIQSSNGNDDDNFSHAANKTKIIVTHFLEIYNNFSFAKFVIATKHVNIITMKKILIIPCMLNLKKNVPQQKIH